jgi:hypothetical protein
VTGGAGIPPFHRVAADSGTIDHGSDSWIVSGSLAISIRTYDILANFDTQFKQHGLTATAAIGKSGRKGRGQDLTLLSTAADRPTWTVP